MERAWNWAPLLTRLAHCIFSIWLFVCILCDIIYIKWGKVSKVLPWVLWAILKNESYPRRWLWQLWFIAGRPTQVITRGLWMACEVEGWSWGLSFQTVASDAISRLVMPKFNWIQDTQLVSAGELSSCGGEKSPHILMTKDEVICIVLTVWK